jgi:hypothetical protein
MYGMMSLMAPAMVAAWLDKDHDSCYLLTDFLYKVDLVADDEEDRHLIDAPFKAAEAAVEAAVGSCNEVHQMLALYGAIRTMARVKMIRVMQTEVMQSSGRKTAEAAMDWSSWGILCVTTVYIALMGIPGGAKTDDNGVATGWYVACHSAVLILVVPLMVIFWRRFLVRKRLMYTLKCLPPRIILGYALLFWGAAVAYPNTGFEVSDPIMSTTFLLIFTWMLTLDACNCSRRCHLFAFTFCFLGLVFGAVMTSFFSPDLVINNGTETGTGWVGRFTKNGVRNTSNCGIMSLMAPAMVAAWLDKDHDSCYLLTDFLYKVDLVAA